MRWYDARDGKERLALFVHPDAKRWVLFTPEGFYDASPGAESLIGYQLNQGPDREGQFIGSDQLVKVFNRSDLVTRRLAGNESPITGRRTTYRRCAHGAGQGVAATAGATISRPTHAERRRRSCVNFKVTDQGGGIGQIVYRINGQEIEGQT